MLVKRPILAGDKRVLVGFKEEDWAEVLLEYKQVEEGQIDKKKASKKETAKKETSKKKDDNKEATKKKDGKKDTDKKKISEKQNVKIENLMDYVKGLKSNLNGIELYNKYKEDIETVTPQEAFEVFHGLLEEGTKASEILVFLDRVIHAFYTSLFNYRWQKPESANFLTDLIRENEGLVRKTDEIRDLLAEPNLQIKKETILPKLIDLQVFDDHYLKKENILFPYMESARAEFQGLSIMWALHDLVRARLKETITVLEDDNSTEAEVNQVIGSLFFGMLGLKKKEELILLPAASEVLNDDQWVDMYKQSLEYNFPFIERPDIEVENEEKIEILEEGRFKTETGELNFEEIVRIFNALPIDLTFVDENNKVKYFTKPQDRIFPRSPAIIGRDVNNCHPPDSVHIVEDIVASFRKGEEDTAKFWINMKGRLILIQYFALRDKDGNYKGVLEASQDISEIKELEGERRLLKWGK